MARLGFIIAFNSLPIKGCRDAQVLTIWVQSSQQLFAKCNSRSGAHIHSTRARVSFLSLSPICCVIVPLFSYSTVLLKSRPTLLFTQRHSLPPNLSLPAHDLCLKCYFSSENFSLTPLGHWDKALGFAHLGSCIKPQPDFHFSSAWACSRSSARPRGFSRGLSVFELEFLVLGE